MLLARLPKSMCRLPQAAAAILLAALLGSCTRNPVELRLVAPRQPVDREIAEDLVRAFERSPRIRLTLVPHGDNTVSSLEALTNGIGDLALVYNIEEFRDGIETVIPLYPTVLHIGYRDSLNPASGEDLLTGTTVFAGFRGSASRLMLEASARHLGIEPGEIQYVESVTPRPDVVVVFAPIKTGLLDDFPDYRLFSIGTVDQLGRGSVVESVSLLQPQLRPIVLPVDTYPNIVTAPVVALSVDKLLVARHRIPEPVIYDLISEVLRLKPALAANNPGLFHKLSDDFDASNSTFVIHPGAQTYIDRDAPSIYERYSGIAEVAVTLLVALMSGTFAAVRIYKIRRKNRIDTFYKRAIAIRRSVPDSACPEAAMKAIVEIRNLQENAFDLLVDEKLAADESFRIFITLCNDIVSDLHG